MAARARSLAAVEWQLVLQACDLPTLLRLARCCRDLYAHAQSPIAWTESPLLCVEYSVASAASDALVRKLSTPLLRHAALRVRWTHPALPTPGPDQPLPAPPRPKEPELEGLLALPSIRCLDARGREAVDSNAWRRLLAHPALARVSELHIGSESFESVQVSADCIAVVADGMPLLRTFSLHVCSFHPLPFGLHAAVAGLSQLTALRVSDRAQPSTLGALAKSDMRLRRLELRNPQLHYIGELAALLLSPPMRALQHLALDEFSCPGLSDADASLVFATLAQLRHLHLRMLGDTPDQVLWALIHGPAAALRRLLLVFRVPMEDSSSELPQEATLLSLIRALPQLHVHLLPLPPYNASHAPSAAAAASQRAACEELAHAIGERVDVVAELPELFRF